MAGVIDPKAVFRRIDEMKTDVQIPMESIDSREIIGFLNQYAVDGGLIDSSTTKLIALGFSGKGRMKKYVVGVFAHVIHEFLVNFQAHGTVKAVRRLQSGAITEDEFEKGQPK